MANREASSRSLRFVFDVQPKRRSSKGVFPSYLTLKQDAVSPEPKFK